MQTLAISLWFPEQCLLGFFILEKQLASQDMFLLRSKLSITVYFFLVLCRPSSLQSLSFLKISILFCASRNWWIIVVFLQRNSLTITLVLQKYWDLLQPYSNDRLSKNIENFLCKYKTVNNHIIPSTHAERKVTNLSVRHSFTLYPSPSPYSQTELQMEERINPGWAG